MRKINYLFISLLIAGTLSAQYSIKGTAGKSGIISKYDRSAISYDIGTSRAAFNIGFKDTPGLRDADSEDAYPKFGNDFLFNFQIGIPITDNIGSIFGGGKFNPGVDLSFEPVYTFESDKKSIPVFMRLEYAVSETKFGFIDASNRINLIKKPTKVYGVAGGFNINLDPGERKTFGLSTSYFKNKNSSVGLKKRDFVVSEQTLPNIDGTTTTIVNKEERFLGQPVDLGIFQLRSDIVFGITKFVPKDETKAMLSILGSVAYNTYSNDRKAWFISVGPGFHPKNNYSQILASVQFEFNDIGNGLGLSPTFEEQFGIKLFLGVPFNLFKKKEAFAAAPAAVAPAQ